MLMADIKKKIIDEIEKIDDELILQQINQLICPSDQTLFIEFTPKQIEMIDESISQIENGAFTEHSDLMKSIKND